MTILRNAVFDDLVNVNDIGEKIAVSIQAFFLDDKNIQIIDRLKAVGLNFEVILEEGGSTSLDSLTFVISGVFEKVSRNELKKLIEQNGGKNTSSISAKTSYLIAGENMGPAKLEKAEKLGLKIISEDEFLEMIGI